MTTENEQLRQAITALRRENDVLREIFWREPQCHHTNVGWWLRLDEYEIANLRAALEAICGWRDGRITDEARLGDESNPLGVLRNGDWIGQLYWKLPRLPYRPNAAPDELVKAAKLRTATK